MGKIHLYCLSHLLIVFCYGRSSKLVEGVISSHISWAHSVPFSEYRHSLAERNIYLLKDIFMDMQREKKSFIKYRVYSCVQIGNLGIKRWRIENN